MAASGVEVRRTADVSHYEPAGQCACAHAVLSVIWHNIDIVLIVIVISLSLTLFVVHSVVIKYWLQTLFHNAF